ncbi:hypothetical protein [Hymenobacter terricola]|uniref:hypothetical protein n=1 Tax=Hymenobacter terricola TaxID=2819236 RepID=UPI001B3048F4|nr:hypothetical protein [Hymenobacter terricola]
MSVLTITIDEFMLLGPKAHETAVKMFTAEINHLQRMAQLHQAGSADARTAEETLSELIQLRKVHQGRLDELNAEAGLVAAGVEIDGSTVAIAA